MNFYQILGISTTASDEEIKKAYRTKAMICHPDHKNGDDKEFKELHKAYATLSNFSKRHQYDRQNSKAIKLQPFKRAKKAYHPPKPYERSPIYHYDPGPGDILENQAKRDKERAEKEKELKESGLSAEEIKKEMIYKTKPPHMAPWEWTEYLKDFSD